MRSPVVKRQTTPRCEFVCFFRSFRPGAGSFWPRGLTSLPSEAQPERACTQPLPRLCPHGSSACRETAAGILCSLETYLYPPPVLFKRMAEQGVFARSSQVRERGAAHVNLVHLAP